MGLSLPVTFNCCDRRASSATFEGLEICNQSPATLTDIAFAELWDDGNRPAEGTARRPTLLICLDDHQTYPHFDNH